jgi:hypothetical protein
MTRDQKLMAVFTALTVLAVGAVWADIGLQAPPTPPTMSRDVPSGEDGRVSVQFVGDTMLGDEVQLHIDQRQQGYDWPFDAIRPAITADFTIANAEGPITERTVQWNLGRKFYYTSRPEVAGALARAGIDAVTLANNHAYDAGAEGLVDTIRDLDAAGIASAGAGPNLARAAQPLLLRTQFGTLGIVSIGESFGHRASEDQGGTLVLSREAVQRGLSVARSAGADWVIAAVHWGDNYAPISDVQRLRAREFADTGYDLVIGTGPHSTQPVEYIGSMPVIYSLGNFVFGTPGRWAANNALGYGLSVELELGREQTPRISIRCIITDNLAVNFQPRSCTAAEAQAFLPTLTPAMSIQNDLGVLPCNGCFTRRAMEPGR